MPKEVFMQNLSTTYVLFPVREEHYGSVCAHVAALEQAPTTPSHQQQWDDELVRKQYTEVAQSLDIVRKLQKYLAAKPDQWVMADEVRQALHAHGKLAPQLSGFKRRLKKEYGLDTMPFERKIVVKGTSRRVAFKMSADVSAIISTL
jgi:hypothetical protein